MDSIMLASISLGHLHHWPVKSAGRRVPAMPTDRPYLRGQAQGLLAVICMSHRASGRLSRGAAVDQAPLLPGPRASPGKISLLGGMGTGKNAVKRKRVRTPMAEQRHEQAILELKGPIHTLEVEIQRLIDQDPHLHHLAALLISIPGVGLLLAAHMLVLLQVLAAAHLSQEPGCLCGHLSL